MAISTEARLIAGVTPGIGVALGAGLPAANAATKTSTIKDIRCNATSVKTGVSIVRGNTGAFKIKQNSATDNRRTD